MATFTSNAISTGKYVRAWIVVEEVSIHTQNNTTDVKIYIQMWRTNTGYTTNGSGTLSIAVDGYGTATSSITGSQKVTYNSYTLMGLPRTLTLKHDNAGNLRPRITVSSTSSIDNLVIPQTVFTPTLTKIDRSLPTISVLATNITHDLITVSAIASTTCDLWKFSINNGASWVDVSNTVGTTAGYLPTHLL